jgi:serine/threonine-protein kinase
VASQRLRESPVPPRQVSREISPDLDAVVLRALALEPAMRHHDARELADDLRRFVAPDTTVRTEVINRPAVAPGPGPTGTRPQDVPDEGPGPGEHEPWSAVRRLGVALIVLAVLALLGAGAFLLLA